MRVITIGRKNPKLNAPTNNNMIQDTQNQGDQANKVSATDSSSTDAMSSRALCRKSPIEASIRFPINDPNPTANNNKPVSPAPISSTSVVKAGITWRNYRANKAKARVIPMTVCRIGVDRTHCTPARRSAIRLATRYRIEAAIL